jgi:hypothetical protein
MRKLRPPHWFDLGGLARVAMAGTTLMALLLPSIAVHANAPDWSVGVYGGQYHDTEPAGFLTGRSQFQSQYLLALTASTTVWRSQDWPLALELDGMIGQQWGQASLSEVAVAPVLRVHAWPGRKPWPLDLRLAPFGISHTSSVSPLEMGPSGKGSQTLNFLMIEAAMSFDKDRGHEWFARLHHRCTIYDLMNNYGANGEDFFALGWRKRF